ncbi:hypothetical protein PRIPAC_82053 [Pristionchus pacificus]|uniref:Acyltransferase n=1 Tax=Pristionchus pacificus TaxID=54126 RepID=A0A2A6CLG2_PRIPA|nr:hypothetical protein PRIPAC_82053 [Pristionchus pacificus]|eukprot:PDM78871.1 hypothetical protein PRIPAC_31450 [Pristionchus pacificus]
MQQATSLPQSIIDWLKISGFVFYFCGFWLFAPPVIVCGSLYLLYVRLWACVPFVSAYLAWYYYSRDWPEKGCMPWKWFRRNAHFVRWGGEYFDYEIVKTEDVSADKNYLVGSHPHGMICLSLMLSYAARPSFGDLYKGMRGYCVTLAGQFQWPLRRELLMWMGLLENVAKFCDFSHCAGVGSASKKNFDYLFGQKNTGQTVIVVVGGLNESMMTCPGKYRLKLRDRKGFIRMAMSKGADLVPLYHFGENELFKPVTGICPKRMRNMQAHIMNKIGFCIPFFVGKSLFGLPWGGLVPIRNKIATVIGSRIHVEKNENPTEEQVDLLHAAYCEKLNDLFDTHKGNYGIGPEERLILY